MTAQKQPHRPRLIHANTVSAQNPITPTSAAIIPLPTVCPALVDRLPGNFYVVTSSIIPAYNPRVLLMAPPTQARIPYGAAKAYRHTPQ